MSERIKSWEKSKVKGVVDGDYLADSVDLNELSIEVRELLTAEREMFVPVLWDSVQNRYSVQTVGGGLSCNLSFVVPSNFNACVSADISLISTATNAAAAIDLYSNYGPYGSASTLYSESNTSITFDLKSSNDLVVLDIKSVLENISANYCVGLEVCLDASVATCYFIGLHFKYI